LVISGQDVRISQLSFFKIPSDIGKWASIIGLAISFLSIFGYYMLGELSIKVEDNRDKIADLENRFKELEQKK
jgi:hypothetical protein